MLTKEEFLKKVSQGLRILDGATGSNLRAAGMPKGCCTEQWVLENPAMTESINDQIVMMTGAMSGEIRSTVSQHIVLTVRNWDSRSMVRELELSVGKDLQFIRINGTLVGGIIGLALHAVVVLFPM